MGVIIDLLSTMDIQVQILFLSMAGFSGSPLKRQSQAGVQLSGPASGVNPLSCKKSKKSKKPGEQVHLNVLLEVLVISG